MINNPSVPDLVIFAGMLVGFYSIAKIMLSSATKERERDREERLHLASAIDRMAESSDKVAVATQRTADEAKARNGHLAELVIKNTEDIVSAVQEHHDQTVNVQHVKKQVIKEKL